MASHRASVTAFPATAAAPAWLAAATASVVAAGLPAAAHVYWPAAAGSPRARGAPSLLMLSPRRPPAAAEPSFPAGPYLPGDLPCSCLDANHVVDFAFLSASVSLAYSSSGIQLSAASFFAAAAAAARSLLTAALAACCAADSCGCGTAAACLGIALLSAWANRVSLLVTSTTFFHVGSTPPLGR